MSITLHRFAKPNRPPPGRRTAPSERFVPEPARLVKPGGRAQLFGGTFSAALRARRTAPLSRRSAIERKQTSPDALAGSSAKFGRVVDVCVPRAPRSGLFGGSARPARRANRPHRPTGTNRWRCGSRSPGVLLPTLHLSQRCRARQTAPGGPPSIRRAPVIAIGRLTKLPCESLLRT